MPDPRRRRKPVSQIQAAKIGEFSTVDEPATDRDFLMFKMVKADLPGVGSNEPGTMPTGGRSNELADLQACLQRHPDWSPGQCEAVAAGGGLDLALEAEMEGDDATVSDPPTAGDFRTNKDAQLKPEAVDQCVAGLLADPEFDAADFATRDERAFAICQAQTAGVGGPSMPKQEPLGGEISIGGEMLPDATATIEITTVAVEWPMEQCIVDAKETLGADDDQAIQVCSMIRTEFGNMEKPAELLLPEGMSTDQALQSAAIQSGIATVGGGGEGKEGGLDPEKRIKFTGRNRWWRGVMSRIKPPKTPDQKALDGLREEVAGLKQDKSNTRLIAALFATNRMYARQLGLDTTDLDGLASDFGLSVVEGGAPAAAPAADPIVPDAVSILTEAKRRKVEADLAVLEATVAATGTPTATPAQPKPLEQMTQPELVQEIARLRAILEPPAAEGDEAPAPAPAAQIVAIEGTPAAMGLPGIDGAPPEGIALIEPVEATRRVEKTAVPAQRKSAAPAGVGGAPEMRRSTILGGAYVPAEDRKACGWRNGV